MQTNTKPILFSTPMVKAILAGNKTMTRRVVKGTALMWLADNMFTPSFVADPENHLCPYGNPGDILWVRETWAESRWHTGHIFRADDPSEAIHSDVSWRPSIFMPREACRIWLRVKAVRVERVQEIIEEDAAAEGLQNFYGPNKYGPYYTNKIRFMDIWDQLNAARGFGWDKNPWVWVIEFERSNDNA